MYLDCLVEIPETKGKLAYLKRGKTTYVYYETDRTYDPGKQYTAPKRVVIGKKSEANPSMLQPNENFLRFLPDVPLPQEQDRTSRSSCVRIGGYIVIKKLIEECGVADILKKYLKPKDLGLFLDLAAYSIIMENNAAQYYPDYAYNHPLFTEDMRIYSDSKVSNFLGTLSRDCSISFLNDWNENRDHREKVYISYDSTNKNCQAGDIEMLEYGNAKEDANVPIFNYSIAYDTNNREPLFYEKYPGSINDVSQRQFMLDRSRSYGYRKIGFILDRGYFSKRNIEYMDECGYSFVIVVKGMAGFINNLVKENKGSFEEEWLNAITDYGVYGKTVKRKMYRTDKRDRYFHIYYSSVRAANEKRELEKKIAEMKEYLMKHTNEKCSFGGVYEHYFYLHYDESGEVFVYPEERTQVISEELKLCGYFSIVTSDKMTAKEAIDLYKSRDASEKLFRGDKSYLGNSCLRVHSDEAADSKIFIEFIALILRCRMYVKLKDEMNLLKKKPNFMTVPAALRELEKIEMVRQLDNVYRLDHAVTATQKTILKAFGLNAENVKYSASAISEELRR